MTTRIDVQGWLEHPVTKEFMDDIKERAEKAQLDCLAAVSREAYAKASEIGGYWSALIDVAAWADEDDDE
jgi:hypothetical protein